MTPGKLALTIYQGATFRRVLRLTDSAGDPIDLSGATVRMHVRSRKPGITLRTSQECE
ncbi:MAG TPA: hypothetical protein PLC99_22405 [Verrucomicrobiota bacterium]|nr:hypothetical protein [Verrucomicrobiota bacterium]